MTRIQRNALKVRVSKNLKFQKKEYRKLQSLSSRLHLRHDRLFKAAFSNVRKEIRLFRKINSKLK